MVAHSNPEKVLITGSEGFTGQHLWQALLDSDYDAYGFSHGQPTRTQQYQVDITNYHVLREMIAKIQPDYIIHLAAISFVAHADERAFYDVNLFGTQNLLYALAETNCNPKKLIIASSANVYGNPEVNMISESICPKPINHYAISKLAMEHMLSNWFDKFSIIMTRPFNYTGPGQSENFLLPKIVSHYARKQQSIKLGNIDVVRDFSDISFIVNCYIELMCAKESSTIVNLCSGTGTSIQEVLNYMTDIAGYKINVEVNQDLVRTNEIKMLIGDNAKLFNLIGQQEIVPIKTILESIYNGYYS